MTIDLTDGANAGWMSFSAEDAGTTDDGCQRVRITRAHGDYVIIAVDEGDEPATIEELDRGGDVFDGWVVEAEKWFRAHVLSEPNVYRG